MTPEVGLLWAVMALIMLAIAFTVGGGDKHFLVFAALAGLILRLLFMAGLYWAAPISLAHRKSGLAGFVFYDDHARDQLGWILAQSGDIFQLLPISYHYPGAIYLSALIYEYVTSGQHLVLANISVYAFIGSLATVFVFLAGRNLFGGKVARVAALVMALHPEAAFWSSVLLREPLHMCALAAMLWGVSLAYVGRGFLGKAIGLAAACAALLLHRQFASATLLAGLVLFYFIPGKRLCYLITAGVLASLFIGFSVFTEHIGLGTANRSSALVIENNLISAISSNISREAAKGSERPAGLRPDVNDRPFHQQIFSKELRQDVRAALPPPLHFGLDIMFGTINPHVGTSLFWDAWIYKISFLVRGVTWQLLLPVLIIGILTMCNAPLVRVFRGETLPAAIAFLAIGVIVVAAIEQQGDIWDGLRHRSFGFPLYALVVGWIWQHVSKRGFSWLCRLLIATVVGNLLLFIVYYMKWGGFDGLWLLASFYMAALASGGYLVYLRLGADILPQPAKDNRT